MTPWTERSGRLSVFKTVVFASLFVPVLLIAREFWFGDFNPRPYSIANHAAGDWAIRLLILTLAISPLRRITGWNRLVTVRRMLGVACFLYAALHVVLYVGDLGWGVARALSEIASRFYLTVGFIAVTGLLALAATSTDAAVRTLRHNWGRLHALVHPIAALALWHFFLQSRFDVSEPTFLAGLYAALVALRLCNRFGSGSGPVAIALSALFAALATVAVEIAWFHFNNGIAPARVVAADLSLAAGLRPVWWVLLVALAPLLASRQTVQFVRPLFTRRKSV